MVHKSNNSKFVKKNPRGCVSRDWIEIFIEQPSLSTHGAISLSAASLPSSRPRTESSLGKLAASSHIPFGNFFLTYVYRVPNLSSCPPPPLFPTLPPSSAPAPAPPKHPLHNNKKEKKEQQCPVFFPCPNTGLKRPCTHTHGFPRYIIHFTHMRTFFLPFPKKHVGAMRRERIKRENNGGFFWPNIRFFSRETLLPMLALLRTVTSMKLAQETKNASLLFYKC